MTHFTVRRVKSSPKTLVVISMGDDVLRMKPKETEWREVPEKLAVRAASLGFSVEPAGKEPAEDAV